MQTSNTDMVMVSRVNLYVWWTSSCPWGPRRPLEPGDIRIFAFLHRWSWGGWEGRDLVLAVRGVGSHLVQSRFGVLQINSVFVLQDISSKSSLFICLHSSKEENPLLSLIKYQDVVNKHGLTVPGLANAAHFSPRGGSHSFGNVLKRLAVSGSIKSRKPWGARAHHF